MKSRARSGEFLSRIISALLRSFEISCAENSAKKDSPKAQMPGSSDSISKISTGTLR